MEISYYDIKNTNLRIIDLSELFAKSDVFISKKAILEHITNKNILKRFRYHFMFYNWCENIKLNNSKIIVYHYTISDNKTENTIINKFSSFFQVYIIKDKITFSKLIKNNLTNLGKKHEFTNKVNSIIYKQNSKTNKIGFFSQLSVFCKKNGLTFLTKQYFSDIRNRINIIV
jgi:hypothetical protein